MVDRGSTVSVGRRVLRTDRRNLHALYEQVGPEPSDGDRSVGYIVDPALAIEICEAVNGRREQRPVSPLDDCTYVCRAQRIHAGGGHMPPREDGTCGWCGKEVAS